MVDVESQQEMVLPPSNWGIPRHFDMKVNVPLVL
jgi:hypothetical protein